MPFRTALCNPTFSSAPVSHRPTLGVEGPTRTTICAGGPRLPSTSRSCTVRIESPGGYAAVADTKSQNCTLAAGLIGRASRDASKTVHGAEGAKT